MGNFTPDLRMSAPDPTVRVIGSTTSEISLADEAEYDLGDVAVGRYEARFIDDERPRRVGFQVAAKAEIAFTGSAISSNVLTLTVASGASEGVQAGQWLKVNLTDPTLDTNASMDGSYVQVTSTTATTIVCAFTEDNEAAMGAGTVTFDAVVFPDAESEVVLWDSIIVADNQSENLGALRRGVYKIEFLDTTAKSGIVVSDGTVMTEYISNIAEGPNEQVEDATSDTITSLFVSSGDVILRNGADIAAKIRVTFKPQCHSGLDQDGALCLYAKSETLRLKNRLGATRVFELARVA